MTTTVAGKLSASDDQVQRFLHVWHEAGRATFERSYTRLNYDTDSPKRAVERRRFIACDSGSGGVYLIDRETRDVFTIKAYGVPKHKVGTLASMIQHYETQAA